MTSKTHLCFLSHPSKHTPPKDSRTKKKHTSATSPNQKEKNLHLTYSPCRIWRIWSWQQRSPIWRIRCCRKNWPVSRRAAPRRLPSRPPFRGPRRRGWPVRWKSLWHSGLDGKRSYPTRKSNKQYLHNKHYFIYGTVE